MRGLLLHVAADITNPGVVGPVFRDMTFEYLPVSNAYGIEKRTYRDFAAQNLQYGQTLADFLPSDIANLPVHFDPEFDHYTYGQHAGDYARVQSLTKLMEGDILFFFASLAPYDHSVYERKDTSLRNYQLGKKNKYVIGFFTVRGVAQVSVLKSTSRLALALLNVWALEEEGKAPLDMKDLEKELEILREQGYIAKEGDAYKLTRQRPEIPRSGQEIAQVITDLWPEDENAQKQLLEEGQINIEPLSGNINEDVVRFNHHYQRLRPLDLDYFVIIRGEPDRSSLLTHAIRLTDRFERFEFKLNKLGQSILRKTSDPMRGARWIDENAVNLLVTEIAETNHALRDKLKHLM